MNVSAGQGMAGSILRTTVYFHGNRSQLHPQWKRSREMNLSPGGCWTLCWVPSESGTKSRTCAQEVLLVSTQLLCSNLKFQVPSSRFIGKILPKTFTPIVNIAFFRSLTIQPVIVLEPGSGHAFFKSKYMVKGIVIIQKSKELLNTFRVFNSC